MSMDTSTTIASHTLDMPSGIGVCGLLWLTPLVALKGTTCVIQGVVFHRLVVVYSEEYIACLCHHTPDTLIP